MATTALTLYRGAASISPTTLYTIPSGTGVVTNIVVANTSASSGTFSITLNGTDILSTVAIQGNSSAFFDLKQTVASGQTISGVANATSINFSISGVLIV